ncbi:hypothetical protein L1281_001021 [Neisseria sp. HSC-16F19]|nr:hypothetical protein [Neisseria sp. HSC-16F19]MCP2040438.1 hypothetical protein [Neisseria sp. HSC-16F19]
MKTRLLCLAAALAVSAAAHAEDPRFEDYPAKVHTGAKAALKLNKETRQFRTRFRELAKQPANFAGHYGLGFAGCGTGCVFGMVYNLKTGRSGFLPEGTITGCYLDDGYLDPIIDYRPNSRLLVLGLDTEKQGCQMRFYVEDKGRFRLIHKRPYTQADAQP